MVSSFFSRVLLPHCFPSPGKQPKWQADSLPTMGHSYINMLPWGYPFKNRDDEPDFCLAFVSCRKCRLCLVKSQEATCELSWISDRFGLSPLHWLAEAEESMHICIVYRLHNSAYLRIELVSHKHWHLGGEKTNLQSPLCECFQSFHAAFYKLYLYRYCHDLCLCFQMWLANFKKQWQGGETSCLTRDTINVFL